MINLKNLDVMYFQNGYKVPYRLKCGVEILINPILVENWGIFEYSLDVLRIRKEEINDPKILSMKYLDFIILLSKEDENMCENLKRVLLYSLELDGDYIEFSQQEKNSFINVVDGSTVKLDGTGDNIIKYRICAKDFDDIKSIILHQNLYDYDDRYIDTKIRRAIEAYNKLKMKNQANPTLEMQKVFVISKTGMSMSRLNSMTYRSFIQVYKLCIKEDLYMSRNILKASQKYDIKEDIIHPIFEKDRDIMDEILIDADSFTNKITK